LKVVERCRISRFQGGSAGSNPVGDTQDQTASDKVKRFVLFGRRQVQHQAREWAGSRTVALIPYNVVSTRPHRVHVWLFRNPPLAGPHRLEQLRSRILRVAATEGMASDASFSAGVYVAVLLDLADRPDLRETARDWQHRIDIHTAETDHRPADALLIRPDAHIAWAATIDEPTDTAVLVLRDALSGWFGTP
jgi:hypothetical protein